jgi:HK97 family phage portal protein
MNLFNKLRSFFFSKATSPKSRSFVFPVGPFDSKQWREPGTNSPEVGEEVYLKLSTLSVCIRRLGNSIASVQLKVMRKTKSGEEEELPNHPLAKLLNDVNPFMASDDLWFATSAFKELTGNAYWLLDNPVAGIPTEIWIPRSSQMRIVPDKKNFISHYLYMPQGILDTSQAIRFEIEQVVHFRCFNSVDPWYGAPPLLSGSTELATDYYASQYQVRFFENGAMPAKIMQVEGITTEEQMTQWLEKWFVKYGGVKNSHKLAFVNENVKELSSGPTMKDMEFNILRKFEREQICGLYDVPPGLAGILEFANYSVMKEQRKIFWQDGIIPRLRGYESVLNQILLPRFKGTEDLVLKFDLSTVEALQETSQERANAAVQLWNSGLTKRNETRAMVNLPAVDDSEDTYKPAPASLFDLGFTGNGNGEEGKNVEELTAGKSISRLRQLVGVPVSPEGAKSEYQPVVVNNYITQVKEEPLPDERTMQWKKFDRRVVRQEELFLKTMQEFFRKQASRVLDAFDEFYPEQKAVKDINPLTHDQIFDITIENGKLKVTANNRFRLIMRAAATTAAEDLEVAIDFTLSNPRIASFLAKKDILVTGINETTKEQIRQRVINAVDEGWSTQQLRDEIMNLFDDMSEGRAMTIARTETAGAYNFGTLESWKQSGIPLKKKWLTAPGAFHPRHENYQGLNGQTVALDDYFTVGLAQLQYPGEPGGPPEEVIQCRCAMLSLKEE